MGTTKRIFCILLVLWIACWVSGREALAQSTTSSLRGSVLDSSGNPVSGATVIVRSDGVALERRATTDAEGLWHLDLLPPGSWLVVARTDSDPAAYLEPMQEEVWALDPMQTVYRAATLDELLAKSVATRRFNLWLLGTFAAIALLLAAVGIYGVISYTTRARTHEIGVRMALGAGRGEVLRQVMQRGLSLTLGGLLIGLGGSLGLTTVMADLLYGIGPRDPFTFVGVALLLALVALMATYVPARRATEVDPAVALRTE